MKDKARLRGGSWGLWEGPKHFQKFRGFGLVNNGFKFGGFRITSRSVKPIDLVLCGKPYTSDNIHLNRLLNTNGHYGPVQSFRVIFHS